MSDDTSRFFKGGKSKAMKGLKRHLGEDAERFTDEELTKHLYQHGESADWGFDSYWVDKAVEEKKNVVLHQQQHQEAEPVVEPVEEEQSSEPEEVEARGAFAGMNHNLQNHAAAPAPQPAPRTASRTHYTIEKNRPEQHGIKRPSAGGLCRAVWDAMDELREQQGGLIPSSDQVRAVAEQRGWNKNNAMIEFYQWRKYNGVTGRNKPEPK